MNEILESISQILIRRKAITSIVDDLTPKHDIVHDVIYDDPAKLWPETKDSTTHPYITLVNQYLENNKWKIGSYYLAYPFIYRVKVFVMNNSNALAVQKKTPKWEFIGGYDEPHNIVRMVLSLRYEAWHKGNVIFKNISAISPLMLYDDGNATSCTLIQVVKLGYGVKLHNIEDTGVGLAWMTYDEIKSNIGMFSIEDKACFESVSDGTNGEQWINKIIGNVNLENKIIYKSTKPNDTATNIVMTLNSGAFDSLRQAFCGDETAIPLPGLKFIGKFENEILHNALRSTLCGLAHDTDDHTLTIAFRQELSNKLPPTTIDTIVNRKIANWKKRNMNKKQLLLNVFDAFNVTTQQTKKDAIDHYNMMALKIKPLAFKNAQEYQEFITDLRNVILVSIPKFTCRIKGTSTTFYSENPSKPDHYFDKIKTDAKKADIDIMIEPSFPPVGWSEHAKSTIPGLNAQQYSMSDTFNNLNKHGIMGNFIKKWGALEYEWGYQMPQPGTKLNRVIGIVTMKDLGYISDSIHCGLEFIFTETP